MKVAIYSQVFAPSLGGVEKLVATLAGELTQHSAYGVQASVITPTPANGVADSAFSCTVLRKPALRQLIDLFRKADTVHLAGPSLLPLLVAVLLRKPVVLSHHGFQTVCPNGQLFFEPSRTPCPGYFSAGRYDKCWECNRHRGMAASMWMWVSTFLRRRLARRVAANIVPTQALGQTLGLPRTTTIPHGVPQVQAVPRQADNNTVSFLGRLVSTKGVHVLLQAVAQLRRRGRQVTLQIIGDGPERGALERQASELGLNGFVVFHGTLADPEAEAAIGSSVVVVPSLGGEVFGLVAAQSLMAGRAVVASDIGPLAEVVGDTGLVFPAGDARALAEKLEHLLDNPERAAHMAAQGKERAQRLFNIEQMTRSHAELYSSLVN